LLDPAHAQRRIARQCALVGLPRSPYYDKAPGESPEHLLLMRRLEPQYTDTPYDGVRRLTAWFRRQGSPVHHKGVARLRQTRGREAIDPQPHLRQGHPAPRGAPDVRRGVPMTRGNQGWRTVITSMRLQGGFLSLVAVREWCSRAVLSWAVSITMDVGLCLEALDQAREVARSDIFTSDQGAQFPSLAFTERRSAAGIHMSMDGRGRALDNVCVERLGRTVQ
jgi:putative transposase